MNQLLIDNLKKIAEECRKSPYNRRIPSNIAAACVSWAMWIEQAIEELEGKQE